MSDIAVATAEFAEAWAQRATPPAAQVRPGIWAVPMPLTGHAIRYSVAYLLESPRDRLMLVDAGFGSGECWRALCGALEHLGAGLVDIEAVLLSHNHPDHVGLAERVRSDGGAWVGLHRLDAGGPEHAARYAAQSDAALELAGAPAEVRTISASTIAGYNTASAPPVADRQFEGGELITVGGLGVEVVWTPGHTAGHCCFHRADDGLVLTGDHLLPDALTQLANSHALDSDPLGEVLSSLDRLAGLGAPTGLPGHQYPVLDVPARAAQVRSGFDARMADLEEELNHRSALTGWEVTAAAIGPAAWERMGEMGRRFAVMETMGLLHRLTRLGRLVAKPGPPELFRLV